MIPSRSVPIGDSDPALCLYHGSSIEGPYYRIVPDVRVFTMYALLNGICSYDRETNLFMSKERLQLRKDMKALVDRVDPARRAKWTRAYLRADRPVDGCLYYTTLLGAPPDFRPALPAVYLKEDRRAAGLLGFHATLAQFYRECRIEELYFGTYKPILLRFLQAYDEQKMIADRDLLFRYLRLDPDAYDHIAVQIIPIPFDSYRVAYAHRQRDTLYLFDGPGIATGGLTLHEYLHMIVNPAVERNFPANAEQLSAAYQLSFQKEWIRQNYAGMCVFLSECFVRAIDHRLRLVKDPAGEAARMKTKSKICFETENGLTLVGYLYDRLQRDYEEPTGNHLTIEEFIGQEVRSFQMSAFSAWSQGPIG
jgi:hypothetical protein